MKKQQQLQSPSCASSSLNTQKLLALSQCWINWPGKLSFIALKLVRL